MQEIDPALNKTSEGGGIVKFAFRNSSGEVTECGFLGEAKAFLDSDPRGTICKLTENGRWYGTTLDHIFLEIKRRVAAYKTHQLLKQGYCESGTDVPIASEEVMDYWGWKFVRDLVAKRDNHTCRLCGRAGVEVHHILPKSEGGADNPINLILLCNICHKLIHRNRRFQELKIHKTQTRLDCFTEYKGVKKSVV